MYIIYIYNIIHIYVIIYIYINMYGSKNWYGLDGYAVWYRWVRGDPDVWNEGVTQMISNEFLSLQKGMDRGYGPCVCGSPVCPGYGSGPHIYIPIIHPYNHYYD